MSVVHDADVVAAGPFSVFFHEYDEMHQPIVGGKCASLGAMSLTGLPVPQGFAVTTHAFSDSMRRDDVSATVNTLLSTLDPNDIDALVHVGARCRETVLVAGASAKAEQSIRDGYRILCDRAGIDELPVAVRSSATAEDQPDASFAGQQDTYLWIRGADNVVSHVVQCWASMYTDRAIAYRVENGYGHADVAMSVAVQQMVLPKAAGVAFTLNPTNGDRSTIVIDSAFGLGESVVSGEVTPDNFFVDKVIFEITKRTVSAKEKECCVEGDIVVHRVLDETRSTTPSITDEEIKSIARLARQAEKHFGRPQDIEWAVTVDADGHSTVHLLQSRPETVWSNKPRQVSTGVMSAVDGVINNLLSPVKIK
jgi:pyruvate, water dikinase